MAVRVVAKWMFIPSLKRYDRLACRSLGVPHTTAVYFDLKFNPFEFRVR